MWSGIGQRPGIYVGTTVPEGLSRNFRGSVPTLLSRGTRVLGQKSHAYPCLWSRKFRKKFLIIYFFCYASKYEYIFFIRFKIEIIFYITSFSVQIFEVVPTRQIIIMTRKRVPSSISFVPRKWTNVWIGVWFN